jgi:hypothetical protein
VDAAFTGDVRAFIEFESYDLFGEDFRSDYITGADGRALSANDVEIYQGYIETRETFGLPLRLRIGRQEIKLGKGWLVDDITTAIIGRSWDAIRLTYQRGDWTVDGWWSKLAETSPAEEDGDTDFWGVYGAYSGFDALNVSAYWMLVRDGSALDDFPDDPQARLLARWLGRSDYDPTYLNTIGTRLFGSYGPWDYDWELAYQFGNAGHAGFAFRPFNTFGDTDADYDNFGTDIEAGYSFPNAPWSPRVYLGAAFFEGEDNRDFSIVNALLGPALEPEASVSFNRLFPGKNYSLLLGIGQDLSNFWQARAGVAVKPAEAITAGLKIAYMEVDETFEAPVFQFSPIPYRESDDEIGWLATVTLKYQYSPDFSIGLLWEHLFPGDGLRDGNFVPRNGLELLRGTASDDGDYVHLDFMLSF